MSALLYESRAARLLRFGFVGGLATITYATLTTLVVGAGMAPVPASVLAYGAGGIVSYVGHKTVTFRSSADHASELPKFVATFAAGLALAIAAPGVLTEGMGLPSGVATLFACVVTPVMNYVVLSRLVFRRGE